MGRRHNICVHEPPCCYTLQGEPASDSSSEFYKPRYKSYQKKKRTLSIPGLNVNKYYKRKEPLINSKVHYQCTVPHRCSRGSCEKSYPPPISKTKYKVRPPVDDTSTDAKSVSGASQYTSGLSVDVSCEMAAVNKEIEALLARYEKTFDEKMAGEMMSQRLKSEEKLKNRARPKRRSLSPEQSRLLALDRPPLEKLKEIPLEYLKPRQPQQLKEKLLQIQKNIALKKSNIQRTNTKEVIEQPTPKGNVGAQNDVNPSDSATEILRSMWQEIIDQGLIPENEEIGKNVKPIYADMRFDDKSEIKIDLDGLSSSLSRGMSGGASLPTRTKSTVGTQTISDYGPILEKQLELPPRNGKGDADQFPPVDKDNARNANQTDEAYLEILKTLDETESMFKESMNRPSDNACKEQFWRTPTTQVNLSSGQRELNVYTAQTSTFTAIENLKRNFDEWLQNKEIATFDSGKYLQESHESAMKYLNSYPRASYYDGNPVKHSREPFKKHNADVKFKELDGTQEKCEGLQETKNISITRNLETHHVYEEPISTINLSPRFQGASEKVPVSFSRNILSKAPDSKILDNQTHLSPKGCDVLTPSENLSTATENVSTSRREQDYYTSPPITNTAKIMYDYNKNSSSSPQKTSQLSKAQANLRSKLQTQITSRFHSSCTNPVGLKSLSNPGVAGAAHGKPETPKIGECVGDANSEQADERKAYSCLSQSSETTTQAKNTEKKEVFLVTKGGKHSVNEVENQKAKSATNSDLEKESRKPLQSFGNQETSIKSTKGQEEPSSKREEVTQNDSFLTEDTTVKDAIEKDNTNKLDTSICVEIIRKLTDAMIKCDPEHLTDSISTRKELMYHLKQLRSDHLKHIQTEVKHIEDLDRCLEDFRISPQMVYRTSRNNNE